MMLLLAFLGAFLVSRVWELHDPRPFIVGSHVLPLWVTSAYSVAGVIAVACAIYGIVKRRAWGRTIAIVWFLVTMGVTVIQVALALLDLPATTRLTREVVQDYVPARPAIGRAATVAIFTCGLVFNWSTGIAAIVYLRRQRTFFRG